MLRRESNQPVIPATTFFFWGRVYVLTFKGGVSPPEEVHMEF